MFWSDEFILWRSVKEIQFKITHMIFQRYFQRNLQSQSVNCHLTKKIVISEQRLFSWISIRCSGFILSRFWKLSCGFYFFVLREIFTSTFFLLHSPSKIISASIFLFLSRSLHRSFCLCGLSFLLFSQLSLFLYFSFSLFLFMFLSFSPPHLYLCASLYQFSLHSLFYCASLSSFLSYFYSLSLTFFPPISLRFSFYFSLFPASLLVCLYFPISLFLYISFSSFISPISLFLCFSFYFSLIFISLSHFPPLSLFSHASLSPFLWFSLFFYLSSSLTSCPLFSPFLCFFSLFLSLFLSNLAFSV